ncbi:hypothetical protein [Streptomyces sp. NPDC058861]|uniref:hypothetical protein n=1 Tax=Streptomyces sp. NPDC058861 TaxID=3346653 RepID=UPI0036893740
MVGTGENFPHFGESSSMSQPAARPRPYYAQRVETPGQRYGSITFEEVHGGVLDLLPPAPTKVRDGGRAGLRPVRLVEEGADRFGRTEVWWQTAVLRKEGE